MRNSKRRRDRRGALDRSSGGRRAQRYALNPARNLTLALYCAGERIDYRITGLTGDVVADSFTSVEDGDTVGAGPPPDRGLPFPLGRPRGRLGVPASWRTGAAYIGSELDTLVPNDLGARVRSAFPVPARSGKRS